jgi:hypothetical protein
MEGSERISQRAREGIEAASGVRALSVASAWEMAIKTSLGKLERSRGDSAALAPVSTGGVTLILSAFAGQRLCNLPASLQNILRPQGEPYSSEARGIPGNSARGRRLGMALARCLGKQSRMRGHRVLYPAGSRVGGAFNYGPATRLPKQ